MAERLPTRQAINEPNFSAPNFSALVPSDNSLAVANTGAPNVGAPNLGTPKFSTSSATTAAESRYIQAERSDPVEAPQSPASDTGAPNSAAPQFDLHELLVRRSGAKTYVVHPVSRIQDAFTPAERDLLRWLWEHGRPVPRSDSLRLVTGPNGEGARRFAAQSGLIYNTFKNLTRALATKFALDFVKPERNLPTVYAVYHYSAILDRQRQAGFTGVVHKNGGGRELVNAQAQPAPARPDLTVDELNTIICAPNFGAPKITSSAPNFGAGFGKSSAPNFGAYIRNKKYTSDKEDTTTSTAANSGAPTIVVDALFDRTGRTDVEAARMITRGCVNANPTVDPEEIAKLIRSAEIPQTIANPVGLLIRVLPSRCSPESLANYREHWQRQAEEEKRHREEERGQSRQTAQSILDSFEKGERWDAATIEWARSILAEAG